MERGERGEKTGRYIYRERAGEGGERNRKKETVKERHKDENRESETDRDR